MRRGLPRHRNKGQCLYDGDGIAPALVISLYRRPFPSAYNLQVVGRDAPSTNKSMHRLIYLLLLISCVSIHAQQFGTEWMTSPFPCDSSCLWFRRTFISEATDAQPMRAAVCIATDSRFILYVNGRNVTTSLLMPGSTQADNSTVAVTLDVTRFLRPDSNTVAILLSPGKHLSACFFGTGTRHQPFADAATEGWLCHAASTSLTANGELMDSRTDSLSPAYGDMVLAQWLPAAAASPADTPPTDYGMAAESIFGYSSKSYNILTDNCLHAHTILHPSLEHIDTRHAVYTYAYGFCGFVRVTLRGCQRGERINIGNLTYICSGEMDEQAFTRFCPIYTRRITISGDRWFNTGQIQEVEVICI